MIKSIERLVILKIGGSVVTYKNRKGFYIRRRLLSRIAHEIVAVLKQYPFLKLIVVHGAGSAGHQIAKQYDLAHGVYSDNRKWKGSLQVRIALQKLNLVITEIFSDAGLRVVSVHTGSVIMQENGKLHSFDKKIVDQALLNTCIPLLYGEMVFDTKQGMTICSGDVSAVELAKHYNAERILYASDVDGLFDMDPYVHKNARIIPSIALSNVTKDMQVSAAGSHHIDVTGGLYNKIAVLKNTGLTSSLKKVILFNGLTKDAFKKAFSDEPLGTVISV